MAVLLLVDVQTPRPNLAVGSEGNVVFFDALDLDDRVHSRHLDGGVRTRKLVGWGSQAVRAIVSETENAVVCPKNADGKESPSSADDVLKPVDLHCALSTVISTSDFPPTRDGRIRIDDAFHRSPSKDRPNFAEAGRSAGNATIVRPASAGLDLKLDVVILVGDHSLLAATQDSNLARCYTAEVEFCHVSLVGHASPAIRGSVLDDAPMSSVRVQQAQVAPLESHG